MTVQVTADFLDTIKRDLDDFYSLEWNKTPFEFEQVYKTDTTEDPWVDDYKIQLPSEIDVVGEGEGYPRVRIDRVGGKRHTVFTLRSEMAFSEESVEDLKFKKLTDGAKALSTAMHRTLERLAARNIYNGFDSATGIDGVSIFNTSHSNALVLGDNPVTYGNRSNLSLNMENLKARYTAMMKQRDSHGDPLLVMPKKLLVGPDQIINAKQLLSNDWESGTADRNKNVMTNSLLGEPILMRFLMESPFPNNWFLLDPDMMKLRFYWRVKPQSRMVREEKTDNYLYRTRCRIALGWTDWVGVDGNTGEV